MGNVATVQCRSYSAQEFDGCPSCLDAALEAVTQAGLYVVGRSAPSLVTPGETNDPIDMSYRLKLRLFAAADCEIADDEIDARQVISDLSAADDRGDEIVDQDPGELADWDESDDEAASSGASSMRLDDFQTVLDVLQLAPAGSGGLAGAINGRLYGFERNICRFEMQVC